MSSAYGLEPASTPFRESPWKGGATEVAAAFWAYFDALDAPLVPDLDRPDRLLYFEAQKRAIAEDREVSLIPPVVWQTVRRHAKAPKRRKLLVDQVSAATRNAESDLRFGTRSDLLSYITSRAVPHAQLLADLAGTSREFQRPRVEALAEAYFLHSRLVETSADLARGRIFFTTEEMEESGVTVDALSASPASEELRKIVWRRIVWIRDAFARGMPLADELDRMYGRYLRTSVLLSLEILNQIERNGYDLAGFTSGLSTYHRLQARIQARFGRTPWR